MEPSSTIRRQGAARRALAALAAAPLLVALLVAALIAAAWAPAAAAATPVTAAPGSQGGNPGSAVLAPASGATWTWPVRGQILTPYRNGADPYAGGQHRGVDVAAPVGTPVVAAAAGRVTFAGQVGSSGLTVAVRTAGNRYDTSYLHLSAIEVRAGETLSAGDRVGAVGTTGRRSAAAPHLHFGVRDAGSRHGYVDPLRFLSPPPAAPRGAPLAPRSVPLLEPLPLRPRGAPVRTLLPLPSPLPAPAPTPLAAPRRVPVGAPGLRPRLVPGIGPRSSPASRPHPVGAPVPEGARVPARSPGPDLGAAPAGSPAIAPQGGPRPLPVVRHPSAAPAQSRGGLDLGRVVAIVGLLAAAAVASRPGGRRAVTDRGRVALGLMLRPLAGRR